ncbi:MAG: hypothetical protein ACK5RS_08095, partial [Acidobacteriota bacterium]
NKLTATITTLPRGGKLTYTITARAPYQGTFTNSAKIDPPSTVKDPDPDDNIGGPVNTTVDPRLDLVLQMNGTPVVATGGTIVYTLVMTNVGLAGADGSTFSQTLPAGLTGVTAVCGSAIAGATCPGSVTVSGTTVSGTIPAFPPGGSLVITVTATAPAWTGSLLSTATVTSPADAIETTLVNNNGSAKTELVGTWAPTQANLTVTKIGTSTVQTNGTMVYQVRVINAGPAAADGTTFSDAIPGVITGVSWNCLASGGAVCPSSTGTSQTISQTIATFPANSQLVYTITGTAPSTAQTITNTATITPPAGITDPDSSDNSATQVTTVQTGAPTEADLVVAKYGPTNVLPNATFNYTIIVRNNGPAAANGATIRDNLPNELTAVSASCAATGGAVCGSTSVGTGNLLTGTITTLPLNGRVTYTVTATAPSSGYFSNSVTVTPPTG